MTTPSATAKDYGYYCWINHIVETEPEFGAMGFKGQFITVLPKEHAVVVMTSILPTDGGLRDATYLNLYRHMVNDYMLPAMHGTSDAASAEPRRPGAAQGTRTQRPRQGVPGTALAFNDGPEKK